MIKILVVDVGFVLSNFLNITFLSTPVEHKHASNVVLAFSQEINPSFKGKINWDICGQSKNLTTEILVSCLKKGLDYDYVLIPYNGSVGHYEEEKKALENLLNKGVFVVISSGNVLVDLRTISPQRYCLGKPRCLVVSDLDTPSSPQIAGLTVNVSGKICRYLFFCETGSSYAAPKVLARLINELHR
ncbi:MAG: hypothetical protein ABIM30_01305 [candidate division WOR-3 bacterium]